MPKGNEMQQDTVLLLLHGLGDSGLCFSKLLRHLPMAWAYVALDFRGHGHSDWLPGGISGYSLADHVVDLIMFIRYLRSVWAPRRLVAVAHSMGGGITYTAVALGGLQIDKLVLLEQTGACGMPEGLFGKSQGLRLSHAISVGLEAPQQRVFKTWAEAREWTAVRHLGAVSPLGKPPDDVVENVLRGISSVSSDGSVVILADPRLHAAKDAFFYMAREFERTDVLPKAMCPLLFVHAHDGPCTEQASRANGYPSFEDRWTDFKAPTRQCIVSSGGHYPHVHSESVQTVAAHIETFVQDAQISAGLSSNL